MKKNNNISFDELIKNAIDGAKSVPPPGAWEGIASQVGVSAGASIIKAAFIKTIAGKVIVGSIVVALTTIGLIKVLETPSSEIEDSKNLVIDSKIGEKSINSDVYENEPINPDGQDQKDNPNSNAENAANLTSNGDQQKSISGGNIKSNNKPSESIIDNTIPSSNNVNLTMVYTNGLSISAIDSVYCIGEQIQLQAFYQPIWEDVKKINSGGTLINGSDKNWVVSYARPGKYQVVLIALKNGIKYNTSKNIYIEEPKADFNVKHAATGVTLTAVYSAAVNYKWSINNTEYKNTRTASLFIPYTDFYKKLNANIQLEIRKGNCSDSKTVLVEIPKEEKELFIPNVFTPTVEDGKNDCFQIAIEETTFYYLVIKNRNGTTVFESQNSEECWNGAVNNKGEKCAPDAYFYQLIYQKENKEKKTLTGRVQLF